MKRYYLAAITCGVIALALVLSACGAGAHQKTIATTLATLNAASDTFVAYDKDHRSEIVAKAKSHEQGQAALNEWDSTVETVTVGLEAAYKAVAVAATLNDDQSLASMIAAALIVKSELETLGVLK
jgi:outer membrane murein-binding lipoprotein Lpp